MTADAPALSVRDLTKRFSMRRTLAGRIRHEPHQWLTAVDGVSFDVRRGETLALVGESGSGKTTMARCLVRLYDADAGSIHFDGTDIGTARGEELFRLRGRMQIVFQDPYTSLNPRFTVGATIAEAGRVHKRVGADGEQEFVRRLLESVELSKGTARLRPRQLSGGQRQRVAIARALAVNPELLIADEVVSALDVSIQAQILDLFRRLRTEFGLTLVFISHQLAVVAQIADRVAVMYLGRIVELGPTAAVFGNPQHPYTRALLEAHPNPDPGTPSERVLVGEIPSPVDLPSGCRFRTRCAFAQAVCANDPPLAPAVTGQDVACHIRPFAEEAQVS
jgi:oligopeptide transport system ATP-binding protein